jgi:hypothetical protein
MDKLMSLLGSRKFWAAVVGLGLVVVKAYRPEFPIAEEALTNLVYVLAAYILGVALEDGLSAGGPAGSQAEEAARERLQDGR